MGHFEPKYPEMSFDFKISLRKIPDDFFIKEKDLESESIPDGVRQF
ncbi:MAG: hypothetical protein LBH06_07390 [Rikenellaceae bacterium]|jgi:hypothetical protein|nr:hypothetical protein [Rikenellaceae bacterium]